MNEYRVSVTNTYEVVVEAIDEENAIQNVMEEIKKDDDFPIKEMDCSYGWEVVEVVED